MIAFQTLSIYPYVLCENNIQQYSAVCQVNNICGFIYLGANGIIIFTASQKGVYFHEYT